MVARKKRYIDALRLSPKTFQIEPISLGKKSAIDWNSWCNTLHRAATHTIRLTNENVTLNLQITNRNWQTFLHQPSYIWEGFLCKHRAIQPHENSYTIIPAVTSEHSTYWTMDRNFYKKTCACTSSFATIITSIFFILIFMLCSLHDLSRLYWCSFRFFLVGASSTWPSAKKKFFQGFICIYISYLTYVAWYL
jgi:hypothetical protein